MDELLSEINNLKPVRRDSKSFTHFATTVSCYVNNMEDNGYPVLESSEAPFLMSQLLSKLDPNDNSHFGREMKREGKEETVSNFIAWLHQEASIRSRGKRSSVSEERNKSRRNKGPKKTEIMPPMAKKLMMKHVRLTVKPNIIWLPVLRSSF